MFVFFLSGFFVLAAKDENLDEICQIKAIENQCKEVSESECRKLLEKCQKYYENKSSEIKEDINKTAKEKKTLNNKIYTLNKTIRSLGYQISESNMIIKDLGLQVKDTQDSIGKNSLEIEKSKKKLAKILMAIYKEDKRSVVEIFLSNENITDSFDSLIALEILSSKNREFLEDIENLKSYLEKQEKLLDQEKDDLERTVKIQGLQKRDNEKVKKDKEYFLRLTEKEYQKQLKEKKETEKKVSAIRSRIFELIGTTKAPTFGEAYEIAKYVSKITGARPALLLAVLHQESNIGKNVGQCFLKDFNTGKGVVAKSNRAISRVMSPKRDISHFLNTCKELNRDPKNTLVSCPMSYGWGGAMGPAQFIPSTWNIYRKRVKSITGKAADPWNIRDAFLASGLYLADYGAKKHTYNSEWRSAMIYFSGSTNKKYRFYGDSVMKTANGFQKDIDAIEGTH
ncbi:MAG: lytic murein transglycosylase [Patescibacteria group bacterium]|nr:lytic murein transglycosylase [Patescibacteria group bacterium]